MAKCTSKTVKGTRCKRSALPGTKPARCVSHVGGKVGRKPKLDERLTEQLVQLLKSGNYVETAIAAVGLSKSTFYEWLERGDHERVAQADEPYRVFREKVEHARAEGEATNVLRIARAAAEDWKAAAWMLERQFPDRWGRPAQRNGRAQPVAPEAITQPADDGEEGGGATVTPLDALRRRAAGRKG